MNNDRMKMVIDESKDDVVRQCEALIKTLEDYQVECEKLKDISEALEKTAKDISEERDAYIMILQGLQDVLFEETLSPSERYNRLKMKLNGMSLPKVM